MNGRPSERLTKIYRRMWRECTGGVLKAPERAPTTPSRGVPCLVTNLSTEAYSPPPPFKSHRRRLPSPPRRLPRRPRPGGIRRSEPVFPRAPRDRHAALITAASSNRCQTPPAQRVSARSRAFEFNCIAKKMWRFFPKSVGNFWIIIPPQSFRLQVPYLFCTIRNAIGTQPADKSTPNPIIFHF